jgi:hypothetical protein
MRSGRGVTLREECPSAALLDSYHPRMRLPVFERLFRRSVMPPPQPPAGGDDAATRERRLAERLLEDESLRGSLDDATWQPIQDWILAAATRAAAAASGLDDAAAEPVLNQAQVALRNVAATLVHALEAGPGTPDLATRLEPLHHHARPPLVERAHTRRVHAALRQVARQLGAERVDPPTAAARLVAAFQARAGAPAPPAHGPDV